MMMFKMFNLEILAVCFLWLLMTFDGLQTETSECKYGIEHGVYTAYCEDKERNEFPSELNSKIQGLYLSHSAIWNINDDTFKNLQSIKYLYLDHISGLEISPQAFAPLTKLHTLDLSVNNHVDISNLYFPPTLQNLYLNKVRKIAKGNTLPIGSLKDLEILSLSKNSLEQLPQIGGHLPNLKKLNLTNNSLKMFKLDSLAGFCGLKELDISPTTSIKDNCECLKLNRWINDEGIKGSNLICNPSNDQTCDTSPSAFFVENRGSCQTSSIFRTILSWLFIVMIILAVCFSCTTLYVFLNRQKFSDDAIRAYFYLESKNR